MNDIPPETWCCVKVYEGRARYGCARKATVVDGGKFYCTQHSPAKTAERAAKRRAKYAAEAAERNKVWDRQEKIAAGHKAALAAIKDIANGHNDPRGLAQSVLEIFPDDMRGENEPR